MGCAQTNVSHPSHRLMQIRMDYSQNLTSSSFSEGQEAEKAHKLKISLRTINLNISQLEIY